MTAASKVEMSQSEEDEMIRYGIKKVSIEYFYLGEYGYRDLKDAVAQAKREQKRLENGRLTPVKT